MSAPSIPESFDLLRFSDTFHARLVATQDDLNAKRGFDREKKWLASAVELLASAREPVPALIERARGLPELADVAFELASSFQEAWVDALEKLLAGIMFHAGSRSPVIEALFPHQKFPALRRANKEAAIQYATEFERRLKSSYVTRMMAAEEFAFAKPVLDLIASAYGRWQECFAPPPMPEEEVARLREELPAVAKRLDRAMAQVRLIAEAALLPFEGAYDGSGLNAKPRKRSPRADAPEAPPPEAAAGKAEPAQAEPPTEEPAKEGKPARNEAKAGKGGKAEPAQAEAKDAGAERSDAKADGPEKQPRAKRARKAAVPEA